MSRKTVLVTGANGHPTLFTVASVPEPSTVILCGLTMCGMALAAYRRRMKQSPVESVTMA